MRTTITIDDDVAREIDKEIRRRPKSSFKEVVNDLLRAGLYVRRTVKSTPKFQVKSRRMGVHQGLNYDNIGALLEEIEGATHK